jgi:predicted Fe-S protein YdhL (DUF1289 family)
MVLLVTRSPCIGVCKLDRHDVCKGCGRTATEIARWGRLDEEARHHINLRLLATEGKQVRKRLLKPLRKAARR